MYKFEYVPGTLVYIILLIHITSKNTNYKVYCFDSWKLFFIFNNSAN